MPVVTIRASRKGKGRADLMARVQAEADSILRSEADDRVLVVYGEQAASIYYEGEPSPRALPRAG